VCFFFNLFFLFILARLLLKSARRQGRFNVKNLEEAESERPAADPVESKLGNPASQVCNALAAVSQLRT
jgi:hypothetical protein